jgi:tRNA(Ile)-lysidine synthetase-like protein
MQKLFNFWKLGEGKYQAFWFDGSYDEEIYNLFNEDLKALEQDKDNLNIQTMNLEYKLYCVIMFDQITRNIARLTNEDEKRNDIIARKIALSIFLHDDKIYDYAIDSIIFALMPFRHTDNSNHLDYIVKKLILVRRKISPDHSSYYLFTKFYIATLKSYSNKTDKITVHSNDKIRNSKIISALTFDPKLHDTECLSYSKMQKKYFTLQINNSPLYNDIFEYVKKYNIRRIGVSLSGGVDSMVLLNILRYMMQISIIEIVVAIHIDYRFREEMYDEALFLKNYCVYMEIEYVTREILHFQEENFLTEIPRTFIEDETKEMRFNLYKYAIKEYKLQGICLGHHKGDLIENVFMNIMKGQSLLDLFTMEEKTENNNVTILRPMLNQYKQEIINIAHHNNILYFKDTTPKWSFRGNIRDNIFPTIDKFDKNLIQNLYNIGCQSKQLKKSLYTNIIKKIIDSIQIFSNVNFVINVEESFEETIWTEILATIFHCKIGCCMMGHKNINMFVKWYDKKNKTLFWTSNEYIAFIDKKKLYFVKDIFYNEIKDTINKHNSQSKINKIIELLF